MLQSYLSPFGFPLSLTRFTTWIHTIARRCSREDLNLVGHPPPLPPESTLARCPTLDPSSPLPQSRSRGHSLRRLPDRLHLPHHRRHRTDESGYTSSVESSSSPQQRTRPTSQSVRSPLAPLPPPLKGILKTGMSTSRSELRGTSADVIISDIVGGSESAVVFRASLVRQDRDGYASSPEKPPSLRSTQVSQSRPSKSKPPVISASALRFRLRRVCETLNRRHRLQQQQP
jgi:hypothetical protein